MNFSKTKFSLYKATIYTSLITVIVSNESAFASLQSLTNKSNDMKTLITGPLGTAVLLVGTIGGFVGALMKGNIWLGVAIVIVGILAGVHVENINSLFGAAH